MKRTSLKKAKATDTLEKIKTPFSFKLGEPGGIINSTSPEYDELLESEILIDKTHQYASLLTGGRKYLITRPCRMGKTTVLRAIQHICKGNVVKNQYINLGIRIYPWMEPGRQLINKKGVLLSTHMRRKLDEKESLKNSVMYPWKKYPVVYLSFKSIETNDLYILNKGLLAKLEDVAEQYNLNLMSDLVDYKQRNDATSYFKELLRQMKKLGNSYENKLVILIDEYDAILRENKMDSEYEKEQLKNALRKFYTAIKDNNNDLQLLLITGVTSLGMGDVLSPVAIWDDISVDEQFSTLIGFTEEEVRNKYSADSFIRLYEDTEFTAPVNLTDEESKKDKVMEELKKYYDGYRFSGGSEVEPVYNSNSIIKCFHKMEITSYWPAYCQTELQWNAMNESPFLFKSLIFSESLEFVSKDTLLATKLKYDRHT